MCGIAGIVDTTGQREPDRELLRSMNRALFHRGPDEGGEHFEPGVALGHRRLSIIDLSSGQQPLFNDDRSIVIVFNGEIYNYRDLIGELTDAGCHFRTRSDTEVIVHAWSRWGVKCLERLDGMFAFAIWDRNAATLFMARDRFGKKPLYYTWRDGIISFASELKALLVDPSVDRVLDQQSVADYFALGYVPDPQCIFRGVEKLPPAHYLLVRRGEGRPQPREYWDLRFSERHVQDLAGDCNELTDRLRNAVNSRLVSEVPLGAFLSGGVDSSAVVAMMSKGSNDSLKTCSIAFDHPDYDESAWAQEVARRYHTDHHVRTVKVDDFDLIDRLPEVYDEPFADSSALPTYRVCELARQHVTVALSGDGGDEALGGYRRHRLHVNEERLRSAIPYGLRRPLFGLAGRWYPKLDWAPRMFRAKTTFQSLARSTVEAYFHTVAISTKAMRDGIFSADLLRDLKGYDPVSHFERHAQRANAPDPLALVQYIDFKTYLPGDILVKVDRASMANSLEVRAPLLDHHLVEWAASLPMERKLHRGEGKYILKKAMEPHLPQDLLYRKKMGFAVPVALWFRGPLRERMRESILGPRLLETGLFDRTGLTALVDAHLSGRRDYSPALWALLMFDGFLGKVAGKAAG